MTGSRLFLDSSVWLGYFLGNFPTAREVVDSSETILFTSIISIHEVCKKLRKMGKTQREANQSVQFMEDNSVIIHVNKETAIQSAEHCLKHRLHAIDSILYASALQADSVFITADHDFSGLPKARIIEAR